MESLMSKIACIFACISPNYLKRFDVKWHMNALQPQLFYIKESPRMTFNKTLTTFYTGKAQDQHLIFVQGFWIHIDSRLLKTLQHFEFWREKIEFEVKRISIDLNLQKQIYILFLNEEIDFRCVNNLKGIEQMLRNIACYERDRLLGSFCRSNNSILYIGRRNYDGKAFMYRQIEMHLLELDYQSQFQPLYDCIKQWKQETKDIDIFDIEIRKISQITLKMYTPYYKFYFEDKQQMDHRGYFQKIASSNMENDIDDQNLYNKYSEQARNDLKI